MSGSMKTIPIRELMRSPSKVKQWTKAGLKVQVTDKGRPLWLISPVSDPDEERKRRKAIEEELDDLLKGPRSELALSDFIKEGRR